MRFSLVLATVGRVSELERFLQSLDAQTYRSFELIVVDQNTDDRLVPTLERYKRRFAIVHLRSEPGLSRARNVGLQHVTGDIVAFPDDDCLYLEDLLEKVVKWFEANPGWDGLTGRSVSDNGRPSAARWDSQAGALNLWNVWRRAISFTIFLKKKVLDVVGEFDEEVGAGAGTPWGSGEETEFLIRALKREVQIYYEPDFVVFHPEKQPDPSRALSYGAGMGRVLRKHNYPLWFVCYQLLRPLGGALLSFSMGNFNRAKYHVAVLRGRILGWLSREQ